jgi:hypothetical protein
MESKEDHPVHPGYDVTQCVLSDTVKLITIDWCNLLHIILIFHCNLFISHSSCFNSVSPHILSCFYFFEFETLAGGCNRRYLKIEWISSVRFEENAEARVLVQRNSVVVSIHHVTTTKSESRCNLNLSTFGPNEHAFLDWVN